MDISDIKGLLFILGTKAKKVFRDEPIAEKEEIEGSKPK